MPNQRDDVNCLNMQLTLTAPQTKTTSVQLESMYKGNLTLAIVLW